MKLNKESTLPEVAVSVGAQLGRRGITAVLTGGACVSVYTDGSYVSKDADFVIQGRVRQDALDRALAELGFVRAGDRYVHPDVGFYLEFLPGPLAIGSDLAIEPAEVRIAGDVALALSPTDSCRDRLAAFFHWGDRQSLQLAVAVARQQAVDLDAIVRWSRSEGKLDEYAEFLREVRRSE
ncbi:MAG: hypothetical protein Q7V01_13565 [Vicinamibacterales bacterium]|nr:hypothetical protein [Vicinamibacterales bacterium]